MTIITGPPGSGKSTYVATLMQPGDLLLDLDALFKAVSNLPMIITTAVRRCPSC